METATQYVTFIFIDDKTDSYTTLTKEYSNEDPEVDAAPNMKCYVGMFIGDKQEDSLKLAHLHISNLQKKEGVDFKKIRELSKRKTDGSWISYPDGSKIMILPEGA